MKDYEQSGEKSKEKRSVAGLRKGLRNPVRHAVETYYRPALIGDKQIAFIPWLVETLLFTIGRLGVPLFLAISGTLLLSKEKDIFSF